MKTDRYNDMIQAFQCDFSLVKSGVHFLSELDEEISTEGSRINRDIKLLEELELYLRMGKVEIHMVDEHG